MAYNQSNKLRQFQHIVSLYNEMKQADIPDTYIVRVEFPKRGIFISRRTWVKIKGMKPSELNPDGQLSMFEP